MMSKKITQKGSITIPKTIRTEAGLFPGNAVDIIVCEDSKGIYITPHVQTCKFCGSVENVTSVLGTEICHKCAGKIAKECLSNDNSAEN